MRKVSIILRVSPEQCEGLLTDAASAPAARADASEFEGLRDRGRAVCKISTPGWRPSLLYRGIWPSETSMKPSTTALAKVLNSSRLDLLVLGKASIDDDSGDRNAECGNDCSCSQFGRNFG